MVQWDMREAKLKNEIYLAECIFWGGNIWEAAALELIHEKTFCQKSITCHVPGYRSV